jgi:hypothetical protein
MLDALSYRMWPEPFDELRAHVDALCYRMCAEPFDKLRTAPVEGHSSSPQLSHLGRPGIV